MTRFIIDPELSKVWIEGSSSVHGINASAAGLNGWIEVEVIKTGVAATPRMAGELRIEVDRLRSGNPIVDSETRRRIDAKNYPEIVGTVTSAERVDKNKVAVVGELAFRGQTNTVSGTVTASLDGDELTIEGEQTFDVREWGLKPPRVGLLKVHPDVLVRLSLVARR